MLPLPKGDAVDEDYRPGRQDLPVRRGLELFDEAAGHPVDSRDSGRESGVRQVRQRHPGDAILAGQVGEAYAPPRESAAKVQGAYLMLHALAASRLPASAYAGRSVQLPPWPWR